MVSMSGETEELLWKIKALLEMRASHKRHPKHFTAKELAKVWDITERQAYRDLAEADEFFKQLAPFICMQPDLTNELTFKQYLKHLDELGLLERFTENLKKSD